MVSKYAKSRCPDRDTLQSLYDSGLTQKQIGEKYEVGWQTVLSWMKKMGIKSRGILHIVKSGSENPQWKEGNISYSGFHYRVVSERGNPSKCESCGTTDQNKQYDWACVGDYKNTADYKRMCHSCHLKMDRLETRITGSSRKQDFVNFLSHS